MAFEVIENIEDRAGETVIRRKIYRTDDPQYPSGYRYALHYGFLDGRGVILRDDNENRTPVATNGTHPTASTRSSSPECWNSVTDS